MPKVSLRFAPYMRGQPEWREIDATVVGDLAVHRPAWLRSNGDLDIFGRRWTVSHIPSGDVIESAFPPRLKDRGAVTAKRADLVAWATALQAACPAFFEAARIGDKEAMEPLARAVLDTGRAL